MTWLIYLLANLIVLAIMRRKIGLSFEDSLAASQTEIRRLRTQNGELHQELENLRYLQRDRRMYLGQIRSMRRLWPTIRHLIDQSSGPSSRRFPRLRFEGPEIVQVWDEREI